MSTDVRTFEGLIRGYTHAVQKSINQIHLLVRQVQIEHLTKLLEFVLLDGATPIRVERLEDLHDTSF